MTRSLTEVVGAGDPLDVYAGALALVEDEIRHTELSAAVCRALGDEATFPNPVALPDPPGFLAAPMPERALATAISMLLVNETLSVGFIGDLAGRCRHPVISAVLETTIEDEDTHQHFGWTYVRESLKRFPPSTLPHWRQLVATTLEPHQKTADAVLAKVPADRRTLDAWPEEDAADLGLFGPERQALVFRRTLAEVLGPRLDDIGLGIPAPTTRSPFDTRFA